MYFEDPGQILQVQANKPPSTAAKYLQGRNTAEQNKGQQHTKDLE